MRTQTQFIRSAAVFCVLLLGCSVSFAEKQCKWGEKEAVPSSSCREIPSFDRKLAPTESSVQGNTKSVGATGAAQIRGGGDPLKGVCPCGRNAGGCVECGK